MERTRAYNVLFLCTGNSARSVMAEAYVNSMGMMRFRAFSAGSHPKGAIHPLTIETLKAARIPATDLASKSWNEFAKPGAAEMDFVITVCDQAAGEVCPVWPGQPITAHWGFRDPAAFEGADVERRAVFLEVFRQIRTRLDIFMALPIERLDRLALKKRVKEIGRNNG